MLKSFDKKFIVGSVFGMILMAIIITLLMFVAPTVSATSERFPEGEEEHVFRDESVEGMILLNRQMDETGNLMTVTFYNPRTSKMYAIVKDLNIEGSHLIDLEENYPIDSEETINDDMIIQ